MRLNRGPSAPGLLLSDLDEDGPLTDVADRWVRALECSYCLSEPAVDDELGANCIRLLTGRSA